MADADVVSCCLHSFVLSVFADLIVGMEELELHYRRRGRYNFRKINIATISVRMVGTMALELLVACQGGRCANIPTVLLALLAPFVNTWPGKPYQKLATSRAGSRK